MIIERIIAEYPIVHLDLDTSFYRVRKAPEHESDPKEYDAPPAELCGKGRLDPGQRPVMYASQDLQVCLHECRVTAEDKIFVATLKPVKPLKLLNLAEILVEEGVTEFGSLDMAVHMLFLAGSHAYEITRLISSAAQLAGFDGVLYPSYFSLLQTGNMPYATVYGISYRRIREMADFERAKIVPNIALFGHLLRKVEWL